MAEFRGSQNRRAQTLLNFRVDGTATASIVDGGGDAALTDNGTGNYTLTFTEPFAAVPTVVGTGVTGTDDFIVTIVSVTATAVNIVTKDDAGAAEDAAFHLMVVGTREPF